MKVEHISASNFGSYQYIELDCKDRGLTLIQGPTGSGKSTLCDLVPWALFGKTAKGGTVNDVLSWPGDRQTLAQIHTDKISVSRTRGSKPGETDLFYMLGDGVVHRGKDLSDTQKQINEILGMDYDLYLASAYYHEFSATAQFFTTTAKTRRSICEQLVDLALPKKLQETSAEELKKHKATKEEHRRDIDKYESNLRVYQRFQESEKTKAEEWQKRHELQKEQALASYEKFEQNRKKLITKKCHSCGTVLAAPKEVYDRSENPYLVIIEQLEQETNPHTGNLKDYSDEIATNTRLLAHANISYQNAISEIQELELIQQVAADFRSVSIKNTIVDIEAKTNQLLTQHFDSELRAKFEIEQADKLEVIITKDGNLASYTQLSKGQRCLLKLCFGVAVMKAAADHHNIKPQQLFFDEALDGLSEEFKVKAYTLLEALSLEYNSIFVVEHSTELKARFSNSINVTLTEEGSVLGEA